MAESNTLNWTLQLLQVISLRRQVWISIHGKILQQTKIIIMVVHSGYSDNVKYGAHNCFTYFTVVPQPLSSTLAPVFSLFSSPSIIYFSKPTPCPKSNCRVWRSAVSPRRGSQLGSTAKRLPLWYVFSVLKEGSNLHREPWLHVRHSRRHGRLTAKKHCQNWETQNSRHHGGSLGLVSSLVQ